jgi:transcription elongation factor Elf1
MLSDIAYPLRMDTTVACPYCGEPTEITVDDEGGKQTFIQDCDVCCHPIQIRARVTEDGEVELDADRA